ncbi:hypothetical protein ACYCMJ_15020, partial [Escherichia coli]
TTSSPPSPIARFRWGWFCEIRKWFLPGGGWGGEGWTTMTITTPTGEGVTSARTFVRLRRCVLVDAFRIV